MSNDALLPVTSDQIEQFARRWGVRELSLFGSMARGEATPSSDIDLMIQFLPGDNWDLMDLGVMNLELEGLFGRPVDLVENGTVRNPYRRASIERDLKVVYAA